MKRTKEFYDLMEQFERDIKKMRGVYGHKMERVSKDAKIPTSEFYNDGTINLLFRAYMSGYSYHKSII